MKFAVLPVIILILLILSPPLHSEEIDTLMNNVQLEEVVVQSFKQDNRLKTAPLSVSVVTGTEIRNRSIIDIKEFSSFVPNFFMPDYGSKLTSPVYIRGIGSKINAPSVGLYVDGVPYFEKSAFDFDLSEISSVEILRGPQGTLYGRNTMGGIINIYTQSPFTYKGTTIRGGLGNYADRTAGFSHYGKVNETFGYTFSGDYSHLGGFFTNQYTGKKADESDSGSGRIRLEWRPAGQWTFQLQSSVDYSDQGGYPYAQVDSATRKPGEVNYNDYSSYKRLISTSGLTLGYIGNSFSLNSQTAFQYLTDEQGIDQDFTAASVYFARQDQTQRMLSQEINLKSNTGKDYQWLFGAFGFWQGVDNEVILEYKAQQYETDKLYDNPTYGLALYHQSVFNNLLTDGLSLTLGLRYDHEKASTDYIAYKQTFDTRTETDSYDHDLKFDQLTPRIVLQYLFPSKQTLYASVTKGYKTGGFNTSFERDEDRSFKPEYSWNYELGSKLHFFDNRLRAEIALFYIDWRNQQIYQVLPSGRGQMLKNAGRSFSEGLEVSLQANPVNGLMLQAGYGFTYAKFKDYKQSETVDYSDNYLPMAPAHTLSLGADYTLSYVGPWIDRLTFSMSYNGTGKFYWNDNNKVSEPYYGILNGRIAATKGVLSLAVWGKNIGQQDYIAYYFETSGKGFAQKGKPFTYGVDLAFHF
ncbi:MAG: TonB-dependent receptor [Tannerella sp.]|nr:TonB-dependent receptor [Tannerella sp.]